MQSREKLPIEVYCRIRRLEHLWDPVCLTAKDNKTVVLREVKQNSRIEKETHCSFNQVFDINATQKEVFTTVALPLVEDALQGTNGLVFNYGVTSSGKTYTMTGVQQDGGLLPRTLDVIFNSIKECQAPKYVIKPDGLNGFEILSRIDCHKELRLNNKTLSKTTRREKANSERKADSSAVVEISPDVNYAIFVSYVEIYNNYIYDLLEDALQTPKRTMAQPSSKTLREDSQRNMYVFGAAEVEVRSAEEAFGLFRRGQQKRKVAQTALNAESSRSHSVFNVRIVRAPLDPTGESILQNKDYLSVSQLSMVDLAGSERSVRTRNSGKVLREAGNINSSLMALRKCIEILRESQLQGTQARKIQIPYRESKLTHLFKTYFEVQGRIKMVVCVNPHADYCDETQHVLNFAEKTKDVMVARSAVTPLTPVGLNLGRAKMFKEAVKKANEEYASALEGCSPTVFSMDPDFPSLGYEDMSNLEAYLTLTEILSMRHGRRNALLAGLYKKYDDFRDTLVAIEEKNAALEQENFLLKSDLGGRSQQVILLEGKLSSADRELHKLQQEVEKYQTQLGIVQSQLDTANRSLKSQKDEIRTVRSRMEERIKAEKDRMKRLMEKRLALKQAELEHKMCFSEEKFRLLTEIINKDDWDDLDPVPGPSGTRMSLEPPAPPALQRSRSELDFSETLKGAPSVKNTAKLFEGNVQLQQRGKDVIASSSRHRRSRSNKDTWIDHKPVGNLNMGSILQPAVRKKSVSELKLKDMQKTNVSKYLLEHQEQDSRGNVNALYYKADVIPSIAGGTHVVFNNVEKIKQGLPTTSKYNLRKRSAEGVPVSEIGNRVGSADNLDAPRTKITKMHKMP